MAAGTLRRATFFLMGRFVGQNQQNVMTVTVRTGTGVPRLSALPMKPIRFSLSVRLISASAPTPCGL